MEAAVHCIFNFRIIFSLQSKEKYLRSIPDLLRLAVSSLHSVPSFCTSNFIFNNNTQFQMVCKHHLNTCLIKSCNNKISFLFCLWRSKIASGGFFRILGKVFVGRPTVMYTKKNRTHPTGEGALWPCSIPTQEAAQVQDKLFSLCLALRLTFFLLTFPMVKYMPFLSLQIYFKILGRHSFDILNLKCFLCYS